MIFKREIAPSICEDVTFLVGNGSYQTEETGPKWLAWGTWILT